MAYKQSTHRPGFTIVELLVVIVVIGVLAAITIISYTGIQAKAIAVSLQSDLANASQKLKIYQVDNDAYPASIDCSASPAANSICLKSSSGNVLGLQSNNIVKPQTFRLTAANGATGFKLTNDSTSVATNCTGGGPTNGLVAYYPMGGDANDYSGNGYNGTVSGVKTTGGIVCRAYDFDGINGNMLVNNFNATFTNTFTVSAWMKFDKYAYMQLLDMGAVTFKWRVTGNNPYWNLYNSAGGYVGSITYPTTPSLNEWHYYTFTYDGSNRKIYLDGVLNGQIATTGNILAPSSFVIASSSGEATDGSLSDIRVYNRALTVDEINALYNL